MSTVNKKQNDLNIAELIQEYKSKWYYFAISVFVFLVIGCVYLYKRNTIFNVHASVLISQEDQSGGANQMMKQFNMGDMFGGYSTVDDELVVMSSHSVLRNTVKELGLNKTYIYHKNLLKETLKYNNQPIELLCDEAISDTLRSSLFFKVKVDDDELVSVDVEANNKDLIEVDDQKFPVTLVTAYGTFIINKTKHFKAGESCREDIYYCGYDEAAEALSENASIYIASKNANAISMDFATPNIKYGTDILNTIIKYYNLKGIESKQLKEQKTADFIKSRLETLSEELNNAEVTIEAYKRSNNISSVSAEASYLFGRKNSLENQLISAETEFEILQMTREFISNPVNKYAMIPYASGEGSATGIIATYNSLIAERIKLENNAKANNIALQALSQQIDALRGNIIATLDKSYENALVRLNELRKQTQESQSKLGNIPTKEREYLGMKRHQSVKEQLYMYLLQQQEETAINIANSMARGIIVDEAYAMTLPVSPTKKKVILIFLFLGLCAPIGYFYARNLFRNKFSTKEELEKRTAVPVLGEICTTTRDEVLVVKDGGSTSAAELFRLIRSNLQFVLNDPSEKVILVTSTVSGEGKSFIAINLASSFALLGKKVCLIGMDIRKPQLANYLNLPTHTGLTQYLASEQYKTTDIILKSSEVENLDIIQAGPVPPNPAELLMSEKVGQLFEQLRKQYDYIIIDSAPIGMVSDSLTLSRVTDATVYVCRANYSTFSNVRFFNNLYEDGHLKKMSLVVNGTKTKRGYGYGYK